MKEIKRKLFNGLEIFKFNTSNDFKIERYFNPTNRDFVDNTLNLWFTRSYGKIANSIIVEAIYLDYSKKIEKYENVEFVEIFDVSLPTESIMKHNEFKITIKLDEGTKVLWKLIFKVKPKNEFGLQISLS